MTTRRAAGGFTRALPQDAPAELWALRPARGGSAACRATASPEDGLGAQDGRGDRVRAGARLRRQPFGHRAGAGCRRIQHEVPGALGRAGGNLGPLGKGLQDPVPLPGIATMIGSLAYLAWGPSPAAWPSGPWSLPGFCPPQWRAWEGGPATFGPGAAPEGFIFAVKHARLLGWFGLVGEGVSFPCK